MAWRGSGVRVPSAPLRRTRGKGRALTYEDHPEAAQRGGRSNASSRILISAREAARKPTAVSPQPTKRGEPFVHPASAVTKVSDSLLIQQVAEGPPHHRVAFVCSRDALQPEAEQQRVRSRDRIADGEAGRVGSDEVVDVGRAALRSA